MNLDELRGLVEATYGSEDMHINRGFVLFWFEAHPAFMLGIPDMKIWRASPINTHVSHSWETASNQLIGLGHLLAFNDSLRGIRSHTSAACVNETKRQLGKVSNPDALNARRSVESRENTTISTPRHCPSKRTSDATS